MGGTVGNLFRNLGAISEVYSLTKEETLFSLLLGIDIHGHDHLPFALFMDMLILLLQHTRVMAELFG